MVVFNYFTEARCLIYSGLRITWMALSNQTEFLPFFNPRQVNFKNSINLGLGRACRNRSSPEDDFRLYLMLRGLANSKAGIWPFSVSHLPGFGHSRQVIFRNCWLGKNRWLFFRITYQRHDQPGLLTLSKFFHRRIFPIY